MNYYTCEWNWDVLLFVCIIIIIVIYYLVFDDVKCIKKAKNSLVHYLVQLLSRHTC